MNLILLIIIISEVLLIGICLLLKQRFKNKINDLCSIIVLSLMLALGFELIYCAFYDQIGFPPGNNLTNSDWLSFLSGYLGFAGSLIMAWLVYKQDKKINALTMQEYQVVFSSVVKGLETKIYSKEEQDAVFYRPKNQPELYIKHDIKQIKAMNNTGLSNCLPVLYFSLINMGKLKVDKLCFDSVKIMSPETGAVNCVFSFHKSDGGNILNGSHSILPASSLNICFILHDLPREISISKFEVLFHYYIGAHKEVQSTSFFVEWNLQEKKFLIVDGENTVSL